MLKTFWSSSSSPCLKIKKNNKRKRELNNDSDSDDSNTSDNNSFTKCPIVISKSMNSSIYSNNNHIYFNNDITVESAFDLNKELRTIEIKIKTISVTLNIKPEPIYLHLTTDGGLIYSALSIIDCINSLSLPVYTVIDGFVASAGTLISLAGEKRFMCKNAYMLIHELRSGMWGKMTEIDEEYSNLKKLMNHITKIYSKKTNLKKKELTEILKKDVIWNVKECINYGLVDEEYNIKQ